MIPPQVRSALRRVGLEPERIHAIPGGWANWTFELDGENIAEHVLLDGSTGAPCGLIDFEDATVGDPAVDLTPLVATLGARALPALRHDRDLGERLQDRLWFYRWVGSLHAVLYGVSAGVDAERVDGIRELRRRIRR